MVIKGHYHQPQSITLTSLRQPEATWLAHDEILLFLFPRLCDLTLVELPNVHTSFCIMYRSSEAYLTFKLFEEMKIIIVLLHTALS